MDDGRIPREVPVGGGSVFAPLRRKRLRRVVSAQFLAETGDGISLVALPLYVYARTGSPLLTSLTFAAEMGLGIFAAVIGGVFADTFNRQQILLRSYVARGLLLLLAFLFDPLLGVAVTLGIMARAGGQGDNPSFDALIPSQAEGDLQQVLAIRRMIQGVSYTIGPAVGALAVAVLGPRHALLLNAATFGGAFYFMARAGDVDVEYPERRRQREGVPWKEAFTDLLRGMRLVMHTPGVRRYLVYLAMVMGTVGLLMASAVVWLERDLDVSEAWFGIAVSGYGIGSVLGLALAGGRNFRWPLPRILVVATPIYALACGLSAAVEAPWLLPIGWLLWGVALGPEMVLGEVFFVGRFAEAQRGRAFAVLGVANTLGMAIGYAASGPLLEIFNGRWVILGTAGLVFSLVAFWIGPAIQGDDWPDRTSDAAVS